MSEKVFDEYALYYDAFYADKDYDIEAEKVKDILCKNKKDIHAIINFGCGSGRHDIALSHKNWGAY